MNDLTPQFLTTRELAELLRIKERKVYELASSGEVPCTRATGKLLFPRQGIEAWLQGKNASSTAAREPARVRPAVFLGSQDPLLDWALKESDCGLANNFNGSEDGLQRLAAAEGIAAGTHLFDAASDEWNVPKVRERFAKQAVVLVEFAWRERGLVLAPAIADQVKSIADINGLRVAPRQPGAGTQVLLKQLLLQHHIDEQTLHYGEVAYTETDAVTSVLDGSVDVTLGLGCIARRFNLPFVPIMRERFDLLVDRCAWFEAPFQRFLGFCQSPAFSERAASMGGYDVSGFGTVHFNARSM